MEPHSPESPTGRLPAIARNPRTVPRAGRYHRPLDSIMTTAPKLVNPADAADDGRAAGMAGNFTVPLPEMKVALHEHRDKAVTLWPSRSMSNKPTLVDLLEAKLRDHIRTVRNTTTEMSEEQKLGLKVTTMIDCLDTLADGLVAYREVFEAMSTIGKQVGDVLGATYERLRTVETEFERVNTLCVDVAGKAADDAVQHKAELKARDEEIERLNKVVYTDPRTAAQQLTQMSTALAESKEKIQLLRTRDDELSTTLISRSMMLDDTESKLFSAEVDKAELRKAIDVLEANKEELLCEMELQELRLKKEIDDKDTTIRQLQEDMANARQQVGEEQRQRRKQQIMRNQNAQDRTQLDSLDWEALLDFPRREDPTMWSADEDNDGAPVAFVLDMSVVERVAHVVGAWRKLRDTVTEFGLGSSPSSNNGSMMVSEGGGFAAGGGRASRRKPNQLSSFLFDAPQPEASTGLSSSPSTQHLTVHFMRLVPEQVALGDYSRNKLPLPRFLEAHPSLHTIPGSALNEQDLQSHLSSFVRHAIAALKSHPLLDFVHCIEEWLVTKHPMHLSRRCGLIYSIVYAFQTMPEIRSTYNAALFGALLVQDVALPAVSHVEDAVDDVRDVLLKKQGDFTAITKNLLKNVVRKHLVSVERQDLDQLLNVVESVLGPAGEQVDVNDLMSTSGPFADALRRYFLSSLVAQRRLMLAACDRINSGEGRTGTVQLGSVFSAMQQCDPDKPLSRVEDDVAAMLGWDLGNGSYDMSTIVNVRQLIEGLRLTCAVRMSPRAVPPYAAPARIPWNVVRADGSSRPTSGSFNSSPQPSGVVGKQGGGGPTWLMDSSVNANSGAGRSSDFFPGDQPRKSKAGLQSRSGTRNGRRKSKKKPTP